MRLGGLEVVLVLIIVLIIFGPGKLPDVGAALGKGIREFRRGAAGSDEISAPKNQSLAVSDEPEENAGSVASGKSSGRQGETEGT